MGIFVSLEALEAQAQRRMASYIVVKREKHKNFFREGLATVVGAGAVAGVCAVFWLGMLLRRLRV